MKAELHDLDLAGASEPGDHPDHCPVCAAPVEDAAAGDLAGQAPCPRCGHMLWFVSRRVGDVTTVRLIDNRVAVTELLDLLDNAVEGGLIDRMVIDFGHILQVSSAALGKLVKLTGHAQVMRGRLKLCGLHEDLRHVFKITHLDGFFEIHATEAQALAAFGVA